MPEGYDPNNLTHVLHPERKRSDVDFQSMVFPYWNPEGDVAHEVFPAVISTTTKAKTTTTRPSLSRCSISAKKGRFRSGSWSGSCLSSTFGTSLSSNTTPTRNTTA